MTNLDILAKLVNIYRTANSGQALFSEQGQAMSGYSELAAYRAILKEVEKDWDASNNNRN